MKAWAHMYEAKYGRNPKVRKFVNFMIRGGVGNPQKRKLSDLPPTKIIALERPDPNQPPKRIHMVPRNEQILHDLAVCKDIVQRRNHKIYDLQQTIRDIRQDLAKCKRSKQILQNELEEYTKPSLEEEEEALIKELEDLTKAHKAQEQEYMEKLKEEQHGHGTEEEEEYVDDSVEGMERTQRMEEITQRLDEIQKHFEQEREEKEEEMHRLREEWLLKETLKAIDEGRTPPTKTPWDPKTPPRTPDETPPKWYQFWKRK